MSGLTRKLHRARVIVSSMPVRVRAAARALRWAGTSDGAYLPPWPYVHPEPSFPALTSQACTDNQLRTHAYRVWSDRLRTPDVYVHRKQWEWFYIAQALEEAGVAVPGARGIGFGVGTEPLTPWFASQGCEIVATDYPGGEHAENWSTSGQLARSLADLNGEGICDPADFERLVSFQTADMRDLEGFADDSFDFAWSSCAMEHLGTVEAGFDFLRDHLRLLRPGGVGVHTTELNVSSNKRTIDHGSTVLFRRCDLEQFAVSIEDVAEIAPLNFNVGRNPNDLYVAPHAEANTMLRLAIGPYVTTSFGLIIRKRP